MLWSKFINWLKEAYRDPIIRDESQDGYIIRKGYSAVYVDVIDQQKWNAYLDRLTAPLRKYLRDNQSKPQAKGPV